jgi:hypothetical protein
MQMIDLGDLLLTNQDHANPVDGESKLFLHVRGTGIDWSRIYGLAYHNHACDTYGKKPFDDVEVA